MTSPAPTHGPIRNRLAGLLLCLVASLLLTALAAPAAQAEWDIQSFDGEILDQAGDPFTEAGGHPYEAGTEFQFSTDDPFGSAEENPKGIEADLPPGLVGNPQATPKCTWAELALQGSVYGPLQGSGLGCQGASQVGVAIVNLGPLGTPTFPVYNMVSRRGLPAQFGSYFQAMVPLEAIVRTGSDYGLTISLPNISSAVPITGGSLKFWGVPADPSHDPQRYCGRVDNPGCSTGLPLKPFVTLPTACLGPQTTTLRARSWQDREDWKSASFVSHDHEVPPNPIGVTGCDRVDFQPSIQVSPDTQSSDSAAGLEVALHVPQNDSPDGLATSTLKDAVVTMPEGVSLNPSAADGLAACGEEQIGLQSADQPSCPDASKVGSVEVDSPLLPKLMRGSIYQAEQDANPFGSTLAIYVVAAEPESGVLVKLAGEVEADPDTGQLTTTFSDNPQLPFTDFKLRFFGGPRAALATPRACGTYVAHASLTPWSAPDSGPPAEVTDSFEITSGPGGKPCAADPASRPFNPKLNAGLANPAAGSYSPFVFQLTREDGDQEILSTTVTPPKGLTAKLAGVPYCPEADVAAGSCPEASRIGTEIAGAGAGSSPFYTSQNPGEVYLAGPYKGAPLSMVIEEPVIAGPLDLDDITVRAAILVDPRTAQLTVVSDEIPQVNSGIPLRIRDLRIRMDRPEFTIAPTNCDPMEVGAEVKGSHGATANLTNRFQVGDCASLGFSPKLKLGFGKSKKNTRRNQHPPLRARLAFNEGDSNIASAEVALPEGVLLDQDRIGRICSRDRYAAGTCPEESRVGYAKATSPLLDDPVEGPVYLKASDNPLPDLAADLDGQIDIDLFGRIDQVKGKRINRIRNTFDVVPDVPVGSFELKLDGGSDGLLVNSRNICNAKLSQRVSIDLSAHNEMTVSEDPLIGSACKQINKKKAKRLKRKAKKLLSKAKRTDNKRKAKKLRKKARKLKQQARKLGR